MSAAEAFDPRPAGLSAWLTAAAALVAVAASAVTATATVLGAVGLIAMPVGVARGADRLHRVGALALFGGVLLAGSAGASPATMLVATGATVVAWDAGENALELGRQVGSRAGTRRAVLVHTGATAGVAALVGAVGLGVYRFAGAGQPTVAVVLLLAAALLFALLLD